MQQGGEPSIEEILASIKTVMARDEAGLPVAGRDSIEPADDDEATDILDLAEADILVAPDAPLDSPGMAAAPSVNAGLPRSDAAGAIRESLAALERMSRQSSPSQAGSSADHSLEAITRTMLRPMLAGWLDANLPAIVERLVQAEIVRIVERDR
jgi:cell pole-organizing protein PopZ